MWWFQKTQFGQFFFFFTVKRTTELHHLPKANQVNFVPHKVSKLERMI